MSDTFYPSHAFSSISESLIMMVLVACNGEINKLPEPLFSIESTSLPYPALTCNQRNSPELPPTALLNT